MGATGPAACQSSAGRKWIDGAIATLLPALERGHWGDWTMQRWWTWSSSRSMPPWDGKLWVAQGLVGALPRVVKLADQPRTAQLESFRDP